MMWEYLNFRLDLKLDHMVRFSMKCHSQCLGLQLSGPDVDRPMKSFKFLFSDVYQPLVLTMMDRLYLGRFSSLSDLFEKLVLHGRQQKRRPLLQKFLRNLSRLFMLQWQKFQLFFWLQQDLLEFLKYLLRNRGWCSQVPHEDLHMPHPHYDWPLSPQPFSLWRDLEQRFPSFEQRLLSQYYFFYLLSDQPWSGLQCFVKYLHSPHPYYLQVSKKPQPRQYLFSLQLYQRVDLETLLLFLMHSEPDLLWMVLQDPHLHQFMWYGHFGPAVWRY